MSALTVLLTVDWVRRSSTRRSVRRVSQALRRARRHPLRTAGTGLLYLVIGAGRVAGGGWRRARLRVWRMRSAAAARRAAKRRPTAPSAHANCPACHGTGTLPVFDANHLLMGSTPCRSAR